MLTPPWSNSTHAGFDRFASERGAIRSATLVPTNPSIAFAWFSPQEPGELDSWIVVRGRCHHDRDAIAVHQRDLPVRLVDPDARQTARLGDRYVRLPDSEADYVAGCPERHRFRSWQRSPQRDPSYIYVPQRGGPRASASGHGDAHHHSRPNQQRPHHGHTTAATLVCHPTRPASETNRCPLRHPGGRI